MECDVDEIEWMDVYGVLFGSNILRYFLPRCWMIFFLTKWEWQILMFHHMFDLSFHRQNEEDEEVDQQDGPEHGHVEHAEQSQKQWHANRLRTRIPNNNNMDDNERREERKMKEMKEWGQIGNIMMRGGAGWKWKHIIRIHIHMHRQMDEVIESIYQSNCNKSWMDEKSWWRMDGCSNICIDDMKCEIWCNDGESLWCDITSHLVMLHVDPLVRYMMWCHHLLRVRFVSICFVAWYCNVLYCVLCCVRVCANQNLNSGSLRMKGLNSSWSLRGSTGPSLSSSNGDKKPINKFNRKMPKPYVTI